MTINDKLDSVKNTKEKLINYLIERGVMSPGADTSFPFYELPKIISNLSSPSKNSSSRIVYYSWIDEETGNPMIERRLVPIGSWPTPPERFPSTCGQHIPAREGHSPELKHIYTSCSIKGFQGNSANQILKIAGIQEDTIFQAQYATVNRDIVETSTKNHSFYLRFKLTRAAPVARFCCTVGSSDFNTVTLGFDVFVDGVFIARYHNNGFGTVTAIEQIIDSTALSLDLDKTHLLEVAANYNDISNTSGVGFTKFFLGNNLTIPTGDEFNGCWLPPNDSDLRFSGMYASQVQALYFPSDMAEKDKTMHIVCYDNATNNMVNLETVVMSLPFDGTDDPIVPENRCNVSYINRNLFRKTSSLKYMSEIFEQSSDAVPVDVSRKGAFAYTNIPFLNIKRINTIGDYFLQNAREVEVLPNSIGVNYIGNVGVFENCKTLRSIPFMETYNSSSSVQLLHLGEPVNNLACGCELLKHFPNMEGGRVGDNVLMDCSNLESVPTFNQEPVTLPFGMAARGLNTTNNYTRGRLKFNTAITSIGNNFLRRNKRIKEYDMNFPDLENIGNSFMSECYNLDTLLNMPPKLKNIGDYFLNECINLENLPKFPNSLTSIGNYFLRNCIALEESPEIPADVTIGTGFLNGCINLKIVHLGKTFSENLPENSFYGCNSIEKIYVPEGYVEQYKSRFPGLPPGIWTDAGSEVHNVLFSWLQHNPDYVPDKTIQGNNHPLIHRKVYKRVFDGEVCPFPQDWGPAHIQEDYHHPGLLCLVVSGDTMQLLTGVKNDLVIQAEYTLRTRAEYNLELKHTYNLQWMVTIINVVVTIVSIASLCAAVPAILADAYVLIMAPSMQSVWEAIKDIGYLGGKIAGLLPEESPVRMPTLSTIENMENNPPPPDSSTTIREIQKIWKQALTPGSPLFITMAPFADTKGSRYSLNLYGWSFNFNMSIGGLPIDGYTYATSYDLAFLDSKTAKKHDYPGAYKDADFGKTIYFTDVKFADRLLESRRVYINAMDAHLMFYLPEWQRRNIYGGTNNHKYKVSIIDSCVNKGPMAYSILGVSPISIQSVDGHKPASIHLGAPANGFGLGWNMGWTSEHEYGTPTSPFIADMSAQWTSSGDDSMYAPKNRASDSIKEIYIGDSCTQAKEKALSHLRNVYLIIISNLRNSSGDDRFLFFGQNFSDNPKLSYVSSFNDYDAEDVIVPGINESIVGRIEPGVPGRDDSYEPDPINQFAGCPSMSYSPNICMPFVPDCWGIDSAFNICGSIQTEVIKTYFMTRSVYLSRFDSITPPNKAAKHKLWYIGDGFLLGCTGLIRAELPELVPRLVEGHATIGQHFLYGCTSLRHVDIRYIPTDVWMTQDETDTAATAFNECPSLEDIFVDENYLDAYRELFHHISPGIFKGVEVDDAKRYRKQR